MFSKTLIEGTDFRCSAPSVVTDQTAMSLDIARDGDGKLWVAWSERDRDGDFIRLRSYQDDQDRVDFDCGTKRGVEFEPTVTILRDATIRVVWVAYRASKWHILCRDVTDGQLGDERIIVTNPEGLFHPRMRVAADGTCWLAFEHVELGIPRIMVCRFDGGKWSQPVSLSTPNGPCYRPSISDGPRIGVWLSYDCYRDGHYEVFIQRVDRPSKAFNVSMNGYQNLQSSITVDAEEMLWIAWSSNSNDARRDRWWLTKWVYLRRFDGDTFADPVGARPGVDVYNEDSYQGWEFPEVTVDSDGRVWIFGQSSHTLYAQYYAGDGWSPLYTIADRHWGSWKPRVRVAGHGPLYLGSMGLEGAQLQRIETKPLQISALPVVGTPADPATVSVQRVEKRRRGSLRSPDGEKLNLYFGDLHAHSVYSDATNDVDEFYHRYRDGYGYDFASLTDHDFLDGIELTLSERKMMWNHADRVSVPGEFLAIYGYEWTAPAIAEHAFGGASVGEGHRHILFPDQSGPLVSYGEESANSGKKLLERLRGTKALVIPHHTSWSGTDWDAHDDELQRLVEVCSAHGRFEFPGNMPIGYRRDHVHAGRFVLDALARGLRLGFVGGSDSHGLKWHGTELEGRKSHVPPGTRVGWKEDAFRTGMTVILAPELTRSALYDALYRRRCYATTGARIEVDFRVNGRLMGSDFASTDPPHLEAKITGTAPIRAIEIVRSGYAFAGFQGIPGGGIDSVAFSTTDEIIIPGESHYYYVRVTQEDGNMAWSSPIWFNYEGEPNV